jgi:hypothetical protein
LVPRKIYSTNQISRPSEIKIDNWPTDKGNGMKYEVDLGNPIIKISIEDFDNVDLIKYKKDLLRSVIQLEQENIIHRKNDIRHFKWILENTTDKNNYKVGWMYYGNYEVDVSQGIYKSISPGLITLALNLKYLNKLEELKELMPLLKRLPKEEVYEQLKTEHPEIFDWL